MTAKQLRSAAAIFVGMSCLSGSPLCANDPMHRNSKPMGHVNPVTNERVERSTAITAGGTVEPSVIEVTSEVSGVVKAFGQDAANKEIDYRSVVKKDQVLAQIDPKPYAADVRTCTARKKVAEAKLQVKKAEQSRLQLLVKQAKERLDADGAKLKNEYDLAVSIVDVSHAEVAEADANVAELQAELDRALMNVQSCTIRSPMDGIIIDRRANVGQSIVSGLSAPSLFLVAKDLKALQVRVAVDEADVARIKPGQNASFTVAAFPGETFRGTVKLVRLNPVTIRNRQQYTVEVDTDNSSERLLPYLTADVRFEVGSD